MKRKHPPCERKARRECWRPGVPIVLATGESWHLPAIDEGWVPMIRLFLPRGDRPLDRPWFVTVVLSIQYRTHHKALLDLCTESARLDGFDAAVDDYVREFDYWANVRPAMEGAGLIAFP